MVTTGMDVVVVMTVPGYANRVAVTSIWHLLVQEIDAGRVEDELGVWITVVGII